MGQWAAVLLAATVLCGVQAATAATAATGGAATIALGPFSSDPAEITNVSGTAFFTAYTVETGRELWKSDGTPDGTLLVKELVPGFESPEPRLLTALGNVLLFFTLTDQNSQERYRLWRSDGTDVGTVPIKEDLIPFDMTVVGDTAFFVAQDVDGLGLWKSDGTEAGTVLVKEAFWTGQFCSTTPLLLLAAAGDRIYLRNCDDDGEELWITDGTAEGTQLLKDIYPGFDGSRPGAFKPLGDTMFFVAREPSTHSELWKSDGTAEGTQIVKDIRPGSLFSSCAGASGLAALGSDVFFSANDGATGCELWKSDGSEAGTVPVTAIVPGNDSVDPKGVRALVRVGSTLFFRAVNSLWKSDGTTDGTVLVKEEIEVFDPVAAGGLLFFRQIDASFQFNDLWRSDGTEAGTLLVKHFMPSLTFLEISNLTDVGGVLFFTADDGVTGNELWRSDGTEAGTMLVRNIVSEEESTSPTPSDTDTPAPPSPTTAPTDTPTLVPTATPVPSSTPTATQSPTPPPTASPTSTASPSPSASATPTSSPEATATPGLAGDVDCDGRVSAADIVTQVQLQSLGASGCNPEAGGLAATLSALFQG